MAGISWSGRFLELSRRLDRGGEGSVPLSCNAVAMRSSKDSDLILASPKSRATQRFKPLETLSR